MHEINPEALNPRVAWMEWEVPWKLYTWQIISPAPIQCKSKEILYTSLKHPKPLHQQCNPVTQQHLEEPPHHNPRRQPTDEPPRVGASCCHLTTLLAAQVHLVEQPAEVVELANLRFGCTTIRPWLRSSATRLASMVFITSCVPSGKIMRTCGTRICSLTRQVSFGFWVVTFCFFMRSGFV